MANVRDRVEVEPARPETGSASAGSPRPARRRLAPRLVALLSVVGPGIIAASAGNDAGGIATYSSTGADFGYSLLWTMVVITVSLSLVQEMCARMGAVTGKGLADLIRENFGIRRTVLVMLALLVANGAITLSEFLGIGAALELFGVPRWISVPVSAFGVWWLVTKGSYKRVEKVFLALTVGFLAYPIAAVLAGPDWGEVAVATVTPKLHLDAAYISLVIALVGTTITPYMQVYVQSSVAERGVTMSDYHLTRIDVFVGVFFACLISYFIIVACGAQLFPRGIEIASASDAAEALTPFVGPAARYLFGAGLFGACVLAAGVLPLSTAYALSEAFGFPRGVSSTFREAKFFHTTFTGLIVLGALVAMLPDLPVIDFLVNIQILNGLILPVFLISIIKLVNDPSVMGKHTNGTAYNVVAWAVTVAVVALSLTLVGLTLAQNFGLLSK